ncbi:hypothetical protein LY01_01408 [Nonlabens xylanidelens]|uniref:Uncharacterized protein n=1 Tax=Nonlabens xylanidelens TaxID=191564 RepID=A0A2S6INS1_9FLAO|nr:hypothetical protein [Nonlabens xylanidelens]PPK95815.1 hypothetical protein LY01_01408 [Nonlabens xylanidelens]PQJ22599.1 hypothetical protein BST94_03245 [Nonlabens xylanidelens]
MKLLIWTLLLFTNVAIAQSNEKFLTDFMFESGLKPENVLDNYNGFDFSEIWTQTENYNILGIIGKEHQRIKIKLISIKKDQTNPNEYFVFGKSCVKGTICDFNGKITLTEIKEVKELHYGVDDEYFEKGIKSQGVLIASYEFAENKEQKHSGIFKGQLYTKWYLTSDKKIEYDNIESIADGYTNNAFIGIWKSYSTGKEKVCNWADFRVPNANRDFDIGAGEFSPSEKYFDKGWANYKPLEIDEWWK